MRCSSQQQPLALTLTEDYFISYFGKQTPDDVTEILSTHRETQGRVAIWTKYLSLFIICSSLTLLWKFVVIKIKIEKYHDNLHFFCQIETLP